MWTARKRQNGFFKRLILGRINVGPEPLSCAPSNARDDRGTSPSVGEAKAMRRKVAPHDGRLILFVILVASTVFSTEVPAADPANVMVAQAGPRNTASGAAPGVFRDCENCPEMVEIPAGKFLMGSTEGDNDEKPAHEVHIDKPIAVARYETTFDEWESCVKDGSCVKNKQPSDEGWGRGRHPLINMAWTDAKDYADWLSHKTGKTYRLLSEAEWEYAARAGTTTKYAFGDELNAKQAKFSAGKQGVGETAEVGSFPRTIGGYTTCMATSGNGWRIATCRTTPTHRQTVLRASFLVADPACFAEGRGTMAPKTFVRRCVIGCQPTIESMKSASAWHGNSDGHNIVRVPKQ